MKMMEDSDFRAGSGEDFDAEVWDLAEVAFVTGADEDAEAQGEGGGGDLEIVLRNGLPRGSQVCVEVGVDFGRLGGEGFESGHEADPLKKSPASSRTLRSVGESHTDQRLRPDDDRQDHRLSCEGEPFGRRGLALKMDNRGGVED